MIKAAAAIPNHIMFQLGDPKSPFLDIRIRQAFSMAIDRDVISKAVWGGQSEQVVHVPAYMGKWSLKVSDLDPKVLQYYKYNPSEARKLLELWPLPGLEGDPLLQSFLFPKYLELKRELK